MRTPPSSDRRDVIVAAVKCVQRGRRSGLDLLQIPIIVHAALLECEVSLATFVDIIQRRSLWQDDAIRSADRRVVIQASLATDGLRCVIQVGDNAFYHCSASVLHLFDIVLPATVMAVADLDASCVLDDPLFGFPGMIIRRMKPLDRLNPEMGTGILLHMPSITVWLPRVR